MPNLYPLRFRPLFRQYVWGGRRLESVLGKNLGPGDHFAESWEIVDHGPDQSVVAHGPLAGATLGELVATCGPELLGRHHPQPRFPLLVKFLDARETLSVQVHPDDAAAAHATPPDSGKTEAWVVLAAEPGATIYAGLKPGVDRRQLAAAIEQGTCADCLHSFQPQPGDCAFIPAGTVHALGAGLLVAEIQQASDITYRLFDWNRVSPDGKPRQLHVEQGLAVIDFDRGPVTPCRVPRPCSKDVPRSSTAETAVAHGAVCLVACDKFVLERRQIDAPQSIPCDHRCHVIVVLEGAIEIAGDPSGAALARGGTVLLPACLGDVRLNPRGKAVFLDAFLP
jgi:mannose-6-phosphate isomerase